jgi:hypothetical protein
VKGVPTIRVNVVVVVVVLCEKNWRRYFRADLNVRREEKRREEKRRGDLSVRTAFAVL